MLNQKQPGVAFIAPSIPWHAEISLRQKEKQPHANYVYSSLDTQNTDNSMTDWWAGYVRLCCLVQTVLASLLHNGTSIQAICTALQGDWEHAETSESIYSGSWRQLCGESNVNRSRSNMAKLSLLARIYEKLWNDKLDVGWKSRYEYYSHVAYCRSDRSYCKRFIICLTCLCFPMPACKKVNAEFESWGAQ